MTLISCADPECGATGLEVSQLRHVAPCTGRRLKAKPEPLDTLATMEWRAPEFFDPTALLIQPVNVQEYQGKHFRPSDHALILAPTAEQQLTKESDE
jgi:hypothetical protein